MERLCLAPHPQSNYVEPRLTHAPLPGQAPALLLKTLGSENEAGAVNILHGLDLSLAQSRLRRFAARIGQEPLARVFVNIDFGEECFQTRGAHAASFSIRSNWRERPSARASRARSNCRSRASNGG